MAEKEIIEALVAALPDKADQKVLTAHQPGGDFSLSDLDLTSLRMVEICMQLEESLGIDIDLEEFEEAKTLQDLVKLCEGLRAEAT